MAVRSVFEAGDVGAGREDGYLHGLWIAGLGVWPEEPRQPDDTAGHLTDEEAVEPRGKEFEETAAGEAAISRIQEETGG